MNMIQVWEVLKCCCDLAQTSIRKVLVANLLNKIINIYYELMYECMNE